VSAVAVKRTAAARVPPRTQRARAARDVSLDESVPVVSWKYTSQRSPAPGARLADQNWLGTLAPNAAGFTYGCPCPRSQSETSSSRPDTARESSLGRALTRRNRGSAGGRKRRGMAEPRRRP